MPKGLEQLQAEKLNLITELTQAGDMRRGSITEVFRRCGKDNCACAAADHDGHGPYYAYTVKVDAKTKTLQLRPGPLLSKLEREVDEYKKFRETADRVIEISEQICDARPVADATAQEKKRRFQKRSRSRSLPKLKR